MKRSSEIRRNVLMPLAVMILAAGGSVASTSLATSGAAKNPDKAHSADATAAAATKPSAKPMDLHVRPAGVCEAQNWQFDADTQTAHASNSLALGLLITPLADKKVQSYSIVIDKLITGSGRDLTHGHALEARVDRDNYASVSTDTSGAITSLAVVQGRVILSLPAGKDRSVTLQPVSKYIGERVELPKIGPNVWVTPIRSSRQPSIVYVRMSRDARRLLKQVRFLNKDGALIAVKRTRPFPKGAKVPNDGQIDIRFWGELTSATVPFTLKNIPTPLSPNVAAPALTAKAEPVTPTTKDK